MVCLSVTPSWGFPSSTQSIPTPPMFLRLPTGSPLSRSIPFSPSTLHFIIIWWKAYVCLNILKKPVFNTILVSTEIKIHPLKMISAFRIKYGIAYICFNEFLRLVWKDYVNRKSLMIKVRC